MQVIACNHRNLEIQDNKVWAEIVVKRKNETETTQSKSEW